MQLITKVLSVSLIENKFDLRKIPSPNKDGELTIGLGYSINGLKMNEEGVYQTNVLFVMLLGDDDNKHEVILSSLPVNLDKENSFLYLNFKVTFEARDSINSYITEDTPINIEDKFSDELFIILEPFFRESITNLFSKAEFPLPPIPYHFWRKS